ncbi:DNA recombination protein RecN [Helicobacter aurati]|uniref:DNA repair protein RecN n=1 Tax=Helicobacter aurati TaxID=137778 RepID=A0A3D8J4T1_9HELI|nr:DNA recombination protein RecN [Helicobacter aurati]RDU72522.1 DNA recombination protein RecN [Helicobacter aurati]
MIKRILINKSPTFSYIEIYTEAGFNVISGISGSGKSLFLNAMLSAFGLKEPIAELIEITLTMDFNALGIDLEEWGISNEILDSDGETIVSVLKKQKTRYFFNRQSISKKKLGEIAKKFIHHIGVKDANELESKHMLDALDALIVAQDSKYQEILSEYQETFLAFKRCKQDLGELESKEQNIESLKDFAKFEIERIASVNPQIGEYDKLLHDKKLISKREKIMQHCKVALQTLEDLDSVYKTFELLEVDIDSLESAVLEARDKLEESMAMFQQIDLNPEALLDRLSQLADINRKYGSIENALTHLELQQEKLKEYENVAFDKTQLEKKYHELATKTHHLACIIHETRLHSLPLFEERLNRFGKDLKLQTITLQLQGTMEESAYLQDCYCKDESPHLSESGYDRLEIFLDSIPKDFVSSGEYNRLRLSMLCALAQSNEYAGLQYRGILIFDEIDANLSGEESEGVAKLLSFLSRSYQIFAISHQPFMPLLSDHHYLINKDSCNKAQITLLDNNGRIAEIARMISGSDLDVNALNYAKTLLEQKRNKFQ